MDFWRLMRKKDDLIVGMAEKLRSFKSSLNPSLWSTRTAMRKIKPEGLGKDIYVFLNGPSLSIQDISVVKGEDCMFVNRGFMHPMYTEMQPKYHVFVDPKMIKGIWPVTWIGDILDKSPSTTIVMPINWSKNPMFEPYKNHIYWMYQKPKYNNLGVSGACFTFAIHQQYKRIYFTGYEATGNAHEMLKTANSHFYGNDEELEGKSTDQISIDLLMFSRRLHDLNRLSDYCRKHQIELINLTHGGLLDMFPREEKFPLLEMEKLSQ